MMQDKIIAVVGVSSNPQKYGHRIFVDLLKAGYHVMGVNPKKPQINGQITFASIAEIGQSIDLVLIVTPPVVSLQIIKEAKDLGIKDVWLQPGAQSPEVIKLGQDLQLNLTHDRCFMVDQGIW